jgi:hypothetical protein
VVDTRSRQQTIPRHTHVDIVTGSPGTMQSSRRAIVVVVDRASPRADSPRRWRRGRSRIARSPRRWSCSAPRCRRPAATRRRRSRPRLATLAC